AETRRIADINGAQATETGELRQAKEPAVFLAVVGRHEWQQFRNPLFHNLRVNDGVQGAIQLHTSAEPRERPEAIRRARRFLALTEYRRAERFFRLGVETLQTGRGSPHFGVLVRWGS